MNWFFATQATNTQIAYSLLALLVLVISALCYKGFLAGIFLGSAESEQRKSYDEKRYMRFISKLLCVYGAALFLAALYAPSGQFAYAAFALYLFILLSKDYADRNKRFRKNPDAADIPVESWEMSEAGIRKMGYGMVAYCFLLPFVLVGLALVSRLGL